MNSLRYITCLLGLLMVGTMALPKTSPAQAGILDEGTFRISIAGRDVGSETFTIRRTGSDSQAPIDARGNTTLEVGGETEEMISALQVSGGTLQPTGYNARIRVDSREERIAGRLTSGRFTSRITSPTGEELREYLTSAGAVLVDQGFIHQFYFLARRIREGAERVPLIIPRQGRQVTATVQSLGTGIITIGGQRLDALHYLVEAPALDPVHLWVDDQSRILRVEIRARNLTATRTTPPRL